MKKGICLLNVVLLLAVCCDRQQLATLPQVEWHIYKTQNDEDKGFVLIAIPDKEVYKQGEPIWVRYILTNNSEYKAWVLGTPDMLLQTDLEKVGGEKYSIEPICNPRGPFDHLPPGHLLTWKVNLNTPLLTGEVTGTPTKGPGKYITKPWVTLRRSGTPATDFLEVKGKEASFRIIP